MACDAAGYEAGGDALGVCGRWYHGEYWFHALVQRKTRKVVQVISSGRALDLTIGWCMGSL